MLTKIILSLGLIAAVSIFGLWWFSIANKQVPSGSNLPNDTTPKAVVVLYDEEGFFPAEVTVEKGTTVTFLLNKEGREMWIASNDHPDHIGYSGVPKEKHCPDASGVSFDQCSKGVSYSFTFRKAGVWGYHNHGYSKDKGTIFVTE